MLAYSMLKCREVKLFGTLCIPVASPIRPQEVWRSGGGSGCVGDLSLCCSVSSQQWWAPDDWRGWGPTAISQITVIRLLCLKVTSLQSKGTCTSRSCLHFPQTLVLSFFSSWSAAAARVPPLCVVAMGRCVPVRRVIRVEETLGLWWKFPLKKTSKKHDSAYARLILAPAWYIKHQEITCIMPGTNQAAGEVE